MFNLTRGHVTSLHSILSLNFWAENILFERGYPGTRVRVHEDVARIECLPGFLEKLIRNPEREQIVAKLKKIGFRYISLDMEGYRTGSLNPENIQL